MKRFRVARPVRLNRTIALQQSSIMEAEIIGTEMILDS